MNAKYGLAITSLLFLLSGCEKTSDKGHNLQTAMKNSSLDSQGLKENIGWIHGTCLAIRNGNIKPGTTIQMVLLRKPQEIVDAKVTGITNSNSECFALLTDRAEVNRQDGRFFYNVDVNKEMQNTMAVGMVSVLVKARDINHVIEFDLDKDGVAEHAGTCLTSEGMQFYISSSTTFNEKALWSDYYYLGYDNKPTCP